MNIKERFTKVTYKIENNFFLTVIRHGLTMMIPLILVGGVACALMNLPMMGQNTIPCNHLLWLYSMLNFIYQGTFGLFSLALVVSLSLCYGMERNETPDKMASFVYIPAPPALALWLPRQPSAGAGSAHGIFCCLRKHDLFQEFF